MLLILFMSANLLHQLISLTRGYWMGLAAGFAVSCFFYGGRGPGARARWRQVFAIFGWLALLLGIGAVVTSSVFGWGDTAAIFGSRLVSSVGTEHNTESSSNFERILEWIASARKIAEAPWMGHGLGLTLHVRHPIYQVTSTQWYIHQLYLWIWLKEGLIGLISLVAVLVVAIRTGLWSARRLPPPEAAWGAAAAAATAYTAALGFTNYPMAMVNSTYIMVLMWGIALSLGGPAHWHFTWRARPAVADDRSASSP
jgi:O-antigen ligase